MATFKFTPTIEQVAQMLRARFDRVRSHPEHDGSDFADVEQLIARLADRDRQLETFLQHLQVGQGAPTAIVTAKPGTVYLNEKGGAGTTLYIKETGVDASGWRAI